MKILSSNNLKLKFANIEDRRTIYNMLISPEIIHFMFNESHPAPTWEEFCEENESCYSGNPSRNGSYILIEYKNEIIGSISYACEYLKIPYCELDIWMGSVRNTGKGLGTEAINRIIEFINSEYDIKHFLIRPWNRNINAIKAYKKCGFEENEGLDLDKYYSDEAMYEYGDGDYGKEETINLIKIINK